MGEDYIRSRYPTVVVACVPVAPGYRWYYTVINATLLQMESFPKGVYCIEKRILLMNEHLELEYDHFLRNWQYIGGAGSIPDINHFSPKQFERSVIT